MKSKNLLDSFKYALEGVKTAFKSERNLKVHISIMFLVIILGIYFKITLIEWIILVILFALVISAELFNTALEEMTNLLTKEIRPHAKKAKDISAGAVLIFAIASVIVGLLIFIPKIYQILI